MATLLNAVTSDGAGTGASHTGACTVFIPASSELKGAQVVIEAASSDTANDYQRISDDAVFVAPGSVNIDGKGTYFLRANVIAPPGGVVDPDMNITCVTTQ